MLLVQPLVCDEVRPLARGLVQHLHVLQVPPRAQAAACWWAAQAVIFLTGHRGVGDGATPQALTPSPLPCVVDRSSGAMWGVPSAGVAHLLQGAVGVCRLLNRLPP